MSDESTGLIPYLNNILVNLQKRTLTCEQDKLKAMGGQEVVQQIIKDVENAEKSAAVPAEASPAKSAKKAGRRAKNK